MSATRTRKAWTVTVRSRDDATDIVYAQTAGKARYSVYLALSDCGGNDTFFDIVVRRNCAADVVLPAPPSVAGTVRREALQKLLHACGCTRERPEKCGFREHFYCQDQDRFLNELVEAGLMRKSGRISAYGDRYFLATELGHETALALCPLYRGDDFAWPEVAA